MGPKSSDWLFIKKRNGHRDMEKEAVRRSGTELGVVLP